MHGKLPIENFITDEHFRGIGLVIAQWGWTERVISDSLWEVATGFSFSSITPAQSLSIALITGMDVRVKMGLIKAVFRARFPKNADEFDKLIGKLNKLYDRRNTIAHGNWRTGKRPNSIATSWFKASGELGSSERGYTARELRLLAYLILERTTRLISFLQTHGFWRGMPSLDKLSEPNPPPNS